jgi:hypothetical protein
MIETRRYHTSPSVSTSPSPESSPPPSPKHKTAPAESTLQLPSRASRTTSDTGARPRTLATLPADVHRHIGSNLDPRSMVAFAAAHPAIRSSMLESPSFHPAALASRQFPAVHTAASAQEFQDAFGAIAGALDSKVGVEALKMLSLRFADMLPSMPPVDALAPRKALIEALQKVPATAASGTELAPATLVAFDAVRHMTRAANELATNPPEVETQEAAQRVFHETQTVLDSAVGDYCELNSVLNQHGLVKLDGPMKRLIDEGFGEHTAPTTMQFTSVLIPLRLAKLEPEDVAAEHVAGLLTHLAQKAAEPANSQALAELGYSQEITSRIQTALDAHGLERADHPALHAALDKLEGAATR